ncbi:hypothetical protein EDD15DRAFT_2439182 [Pisolithus albus]|nr:hypothetical protein EDD15DRAFT_2439182 [Pisolithus albus]
MDNGPPPSVLQNCRAGTGPFPTYIPPWTKLDLLSALHIFIPAEGMTPVHTYILPSPKVDPDISVLALPTPQPIPLVTMLWLRQLRTTAANLANTVPHPKWTATPLRTGLIARKCRMTTMWDDDGARVLITFLQLENCQVTPNIVTLRPDRSKYHAIQIGASDHLSRTTTAQMKDYIPVNGCFLDSIGMGFQGVMKRWNFRVLFPLIGPSKGVDRKENSWSTRWRGAVPGADDIARVLVRDAKKRLVKLAKAQHRAVGIDSLTYFSPSSFHASFFHSHGGVLL